MLRCLNALAPAPLPPGELLALAAPLGSDVPFLTAEAPLALAWGRGERMLALPPLPERTVHLALFSRGVATADAYRWLSDARGAAVPVARLWEPSTFESWAGVAAAAHNDFEPVVLPRHEPAARVLGFLREQATRVGAELRGPPIILMSGSGATVFLLHDFDADGWALHLDETAEVRHVVTRTATRVARVKVGD